MQKTDKKIEEIIDKKFETCWVDKRSAIAHVHKDRLEELKSELNTEVQKAVEEMREKTVLEGLEMLNNERKKAVEDGVRGFGRWFDGGSGQFDGKIEAYLQSLDKGDGEAAKELKFHIDRNRNTWQSSKWEPECVGLCCNSTAGSNR